MSEERYKVVMGSDSGQYFFEASVVDMSRPVIFRGEHWRDDSGELRYAPVCECFTVEDANMIADALNRRAGGECE